MPSIYFSEFSEWHVHHIYWGMSILPYHGKNLYEALHTQGYRDQLLYFAAQACTQGNYPHTQCEHGKVISVGVRVSVYIYMCVCVCVCVYVCTNFFLMSL